MMRDVGRDDGVEITTEALDAAEFRWQVEKALDARAVHDSAPSDEEVADLPTDEDGPVYPALAVLMRARMNALPAPSKPAPPHGDEDEGRSGSRRCRLLAQLAGGAGGPFGARTPRSARGRTAVPALPAETQEVRRAGAGLSDQGGVAGREAADLAAPRGARRHQPRPAAHRHPDRVRLERQPPARLRNALRQFRDRRRRPGSPRRKRRRRWSRSPPRRTASCATPTTSATTGNTTSWWRRCSTATRRRRIRGASAGGAPPLRRIAAASGATPSWWRF